MNCRTQGLRTMTEDLQGIKAHYRALVRQMKRKSA